MPGDLDTAVIADAATGCDSSHKELYSIKVLFRSIINRSKRLLECNTLSLKIIYYFMRKNSNDQQ